MAGVRAHCAGVKDYTGKLVKQGKRAQTLSTSYGEATNHPTMRGESILQADSFHQRKRDLETERKERRRKIDRGNRLGSSYTCMCTGKTKKNRQEME